MATAALSAQEQLLLELINRARLDPLAEAARQGSGLNAGLPPGSISAAALAPLAPSGALSQAAALHSEWMLRTGTFSHTGSGGSAAEERMAAAGYSFSGSWTAGENISFRSGSDPTAAILTQHRDLFLSPDHRLNIFGDYREVGLAQETGSFRGFRGSVVTEDFASSGSRAFLTGVAYSDADRDGFYDVGEGRGGVTFDRLGDDRGAATSQSAGGYALGIPLGLGGTTTVAVTSGGTTRQVTLDMTGTNVKLDLAGSTLAASTGMTLGAGASDGRLLGAADLRLTGNGAANRLEGNAGGNALLGLGGDDTILGGAGRDRIEGGRGNDVLTGGTGTDHFVFTVAAGAPTGTDRITDLAAGERITIDLPRLPASPSAWESSHVSVVADGVRISLDDGSHILVTNTQSKALVLDALVLA